MSIYKATFGLIEALEGLSIDYVLVGSLAAACYGLGRSTNDADFILQLRSHALREVVRAMGPDYRLNPQPRFEILTNKRIEEIQVVGSIFRIDVFPLTDDPLDQERFRRRTFFSLRGRGVYVPTAEDVVVAKLRWSRAKDLADAQEVLDMQHITLDWPYIEQWCDAHGTRNILEDLRTKLPRQ